MTAGSTILAIDLGTQSLRVSLLDGVGEQLWFRQSGITCVRADGIEEQDVAEWEALLLDALRDLALAGYQPDVAIATGPLAGFVALDGNGRHLGRAVMYNDARSMQDLRVVEDQIAGDPAWPRPAAADPIPHWLRFIRQEPELARQTSYFLDATGWLNFLLTGRATLNDYSAIRLYTPRLREQLNVARAPFGTVVATGETIGSLRPVLARSLGWSEVPVLSAPFDSKTAYLGSGISRPGDALDISGTVTSFGTVSPDPVTDKDNSVYSVPFDDNWLVRGSTAASGSIVSWFCGIMEVGVDQFDAFVSSVLDGDDFPLLIPYLAGARAPRWNADARGLFAGLSIHHGRAELCRGIYVGLALELRHIVETIEGAGANVRSIRMGGGLSRSPLLAQLKADLLNKEFVALEQGELTTTGLCVIGAMALGLYPSREIACQQLARPTQTFIPQGDREMADHLYRQYLSLSAIAAGGGVDGSCLARTRS